MAMKIFVSVTCLLFFCFTPHEALVGSKIKFEFESTPPGATITSVHMDHNKKETCVTPCKMKLRGTVEDILFSIRLEGFKTKFLFPENAPVVDGAVQFNIEMLVDEEVHKETKIKDYFSSEKSD